MGFLFPLFIAAGVAALGIPLWMHLRDRSERDPIKVPSLMFLTRLPVRTAERRRIQDWPLLLLRALAIALIVFAFARPYFGAVSDGESDGRARSVILAIDRSMSMMYSGVWSELRDSVDAVLDALGPGDFVAVVAFDEDAEVVQDWTQDFSSARAVVASIEPLQRGTRVSVALRAARGLLIGAPMAAPELLVVSDLQRSALSGIAGIDLPAAVAVRGIVVGSPDRPNTSIAGLEVRRAPVGDRIQLFAQSRVVTRSLAEARQTRLTLAVGGRDVATREVTLPANGELTVAFDPIPAPAGEIIGEVRVEGDDLAGDDRYHFALAADAPLNVFAIVPNDLNQDETLFMERALAIGRAPSVRVERRRRGTIDAGMLSRAGIVMIWDGAIPGGSEGERLAEWVNDGGGLVVYAGPRVASGGRMAIGDVANAVGSADRRSSSGAVLGEMQTAHPLFAPFRGTPAALSSPRFWRYPRLAPNAGTEVLARYDDGEPALLERRVGEGRIIVLSTGLDIRESDFPLQPAFLPLLRRIVVYGSGHESLPLARVTGESWAPRSVRTNPVIVSPAGELMRPPADSNGIAVLLDIPGIYSAYEGGVDGTPRARVAVNAPVLESDLVAADPSELLIGVSTTEDSTFQSLRVESAAEVEGRQKGWKYLILAAFVFLFAESIVAGLGWRGRARRAGLNLQSDIAQSSGIKS